MQFKKKKIKKQKQLILILAQNQFKFLYFENILKINDLNGVNVKVNKELNENSHQKNIFSYY